MKKEVRQSGAIAPQVKIIQNHSFRMSILYAIVIIGMLWWILSLFSSWYAWKAVFLSNGQVFFGKFINIPFSSKIALKKVHYIKSNQPTQNGVQVDEGEDVIIAPIEDMLHGPEDTRIILKNQIVYYERLRAGTTLVKGLNEAVKK